MSANNFILLHIPLYFSRITNSTFIFGYFFLFLYTTTPTIHPAAIARIITNGAILVVSPVFTADFAVAPLGCGVGVGVAVTVCAWVILKFTCLVSWSPVFFHSLPLYCQCIRSCLCNSKRSSIRCTAPTVCVDHFPVIRHITDISLSRTFIVHARSHSRERNL